MGEINNSRAEAAPLGEAGNGAVRTIATDVWSAPAQHSLVPPEKNRQSDAACRTEPFHEGSGSDQLRSARTHLSELAKHSLPADQVREFMHNMHTFETRAAVNKIDSKQLAESYANISRLLETHGNHPTTPERRKQLAGEIMRNCAVPTDISQGCHNTCNVTTVEVRTYTKYPEKATKLVADIASTGTYITDSGIKVKLEANNFKPDIQADFPMEEQGLRSYATQLFNITAANIWYSFKGGGVKYEQYTNEFNIPVERLMDFSKKKPEAVKEDDKEISSPHLLMDQIAFINEAITGRHEPLAVLTAQVDTDMPASMLSPVKARYIQNEAELIKVLAEAKQSGALPSIVLVDTNLDPFKSDEGANMYGADDGGAHVVNITEFEKTPAMVSIDNQWSKDIDHPNKDVTVDNLYLSMLFTDGARTEIRRRLDREQQSGVTNPLTSFQNLESERKYNKASSEWKDQVLNSFNKMGLKIAQLQGQPRKDWFNSARAVINGAKPSQKAEFLQAAYNANCCTKEEFGQLMAEASQSLTLAKRGLSAGPEWTECANGTRAFAQFTVSLPPELQMQYHRQLRRLTGN